MKLPVINGLIDRRILVNFRVDPEAIARILPAPFEPQLVQGHAIAGICLIRMQALKPKYVPSWLGLSSENAAHRIAVEWDQKGDRKVGVFIPRRDTNSKLSSLLGGRIFPGRHHHARFTVEESDPDYSVQMRSVDGATHVAVRGTRTSNFPTGSIFPALEDVSTFFENGSLGYSTTRRPGTYDGLELRSFNWSVQSLDVKEVSSSFFDDPTLFAPGTVTFDNALLMRKIDHEWHSREDLSA